MHLDICWRNSLDNKRALIGWGLGLVALTLLTMAFWPTIKASPQFNKLLRQLPDALKVLVGDQPLTTPEGYLQKQLFLYLVPLLFMIYGIGRGADAIAGEEERNTMDLLLSAPVSRRRVVLEKYTAIVFGIGVLAVLLLVSLYLSAAVFNMDIGLDKLAAATSGSAFLSLAFAAVALAASSATGRKGIALGIAAVLATATFFLNSLAPLAKGLKSYQKFSPWHWYLEHSPLNNGFDVGGLALLVLMIVVMLAIAVVGFERRDVGG
ncbi:MAG: beta-exotoxin transport system permease protein [Actinomycetota bacterium]|nr:beta-exotoxin transport system permease protein [Actinomycetota bacterium]